MLVLARKVAEGLVIDQGRVRITVLDVRGGRVRLGIEAAPEIPVRREPSGEAGIEGRSAARPRCVERSLTSS
ncbi:MAG: carbon storage regulator [Planctomyces sp.]|nr:carbon storage regulator [Planctomyces sp.]